MRALDNFAANIGEQDQNANNDKKDAEPDSKVQ
jgi:hypothetical protein